MKTLDEGLTYAEARGREQAYMEHYGSKNPWPGNERNSVDKMRTDSRGVAFAAEYQKKMDALKR